MKRYIRAADRDDILRRKAAYEQERSERQARYDSQRNQYNAANKGVTDALRDIVYAQLPDKELDVSVFPGGGKFYRVKITNDSEYAQGGSALHWSYSAELDYEGNLRTESNSWSGLEATTIYNIQDLKRTVATLETLIGMDWQTLLEDAVAPEYSDYVTESNPSNEAGPDFDQELLEADIEDIIGKPVLAKGVDNKNRPVYYGFLKANPKTYTVFTLTASYVNHVNQTGGLPMDDYNKASKYTEQLRKQDITRRINNPLELVEVAE